jgi:CRP/FNR family cyclic AMP-dependent transcriptional regulator
MRNTIALNEGLQDEDLLWLFQAGMEKIVKPGTAIVHEGVRPNAIFVVIRGGFSVGVETLADEPLARLGAGELIGEISFLEGLPASATIVADEESAVLVVDNRALNERVRENTAFAARLYRVFALITERRLRNRVNHLASLYQFERGSDSQRDFGIPAVD